MLSVMLLVNEKFRAGVPPWAFLQYPSLPSSSKVGGEGDEDDSEAVQGRRFAHFFRRVTSMAVDAAAWGRLGPSERATYATFLVHVYGSGCFEAEAGAAGGGPGGERRGEGGRGGEAVRGGQRGRAQVHQRNNYRV